MYSFDGGRINWVARSPALLSLISSLFLFFPLLRGGLHGLAEAQQPRTSVAPTPSPTGGDVRVDFLMGGVGGVYFLAEPGELVVEIVKCDRNRRNVLTELRAILAGPDRRVVQEVTIPDDGKPPGSGLGPAQQCRLSVHVGRRPFGGFAPTARST
jgi:hypothetical protein